MDNKINVVSLASGSSGNATYVRCGETEILIDAGISCKRLCASLLEIGTDIKNIAAVLVTHEHIDHVKGLDVLSRKIGTPVHIVDASCTEYARKYKCDASSFNVHTLGYELDIGSLHISSFYSPHDSAACVGYRIESENDSFGLATDLGYVDKDAVDHLLGCKKVILESNYDEKMLMNGPYPPSLKQRIMSEKGHLSNYDCAALALFLAERGTGSFLLAHLSEENNTPEIAFNVSSRALAGHGVALNVADRYSPTYLI